MSPAIAGHWFRVTFDWRQGKRPSPSIAPANGGKTRWVKLPGDMRDHYIARMDWIPDGNEIVIQRLNRLQNTNQIIVID